MSHHSAKASYKQLEERLNRFPQGAPPSETLYKILSLLFSEKEAELVAKLPIKPFSLKDAARIWKKSEIETRYILEGLAARAIILDTEYGGKQKYMLPPPMAGFLEFAFMRTRGDLDQKLLSQLYYQYLNVEEDFIKDLFFGTETKLGRVFIQESILTNENIIHILDYEKASYFINNSSHIGVSLCYCRHKMQHLDKNCEAPLEICLTFNGVAASLIKNGFAKKIDAIEGLELLHEAYENNLVQCGENVRNNVSFICNCCGCCCEALLAAKRFGLLQPINTTNFIPIIDHTTCNGCQKCVNVCPINAITLIDIKPGNQSIKKQPTINQEICLGCGVCVRNCPNKSAKLHHRGSRVVTPVNSVHRAVLMAIEKGQLQNLIFDNQALFSHRAMAAILSAILKLPPVQKAFASKQMKSIYLDKLLGKL